MAVGSSLSTKISNTIRQQRLPDSFVQTVTDFYQPLGNAVAQSVEHNRTASTSKSFIVGIQGSQGSGKSTCAAFLKLLLEAEHGLSVLATSIDDFYLTRAERQHLAMVKHPLFATRGVPGTHDVSMIQAMFDDALAGQRFRVPVFDKSIDDRALIEQWQHVDGPLDVVIFEGWCVGITAQAEDALVQPVNALECNEDPQGVWRGEVNRILKNEYQALFARLDLLISLQAPSFNCVLEWRQLQEDKMIAKLQAAGKSTARSQTPEQIERFISHYQRLTEHALHHMPSTADYLLQLDEHHQFTALLCAQAKAKLSDKSCAQN